MQKTAAAVATNALSGCLLPLFHCLDRLRACAPRRRPLRGPDAQGGDFLERCHGRAGGKAQHMAATRLVRAEKMEMPARHVDRTGGGGETETDQGTIDVHERMDDLLRFHDT